jgi:hypothetical protein
MMADVLLAFSGKAWSEDGSSRGPCTCIDIGYLVLQPIVDEGVSTYCEKTAAVGRIQRVSGTNLNRR